MDRELVKAIYRKLIETKDFKDDRMRYNHIMSIMRVYEDHEEELKEAISLYNTEGIGCILVYRKVDCVTPELYCGDKECTELCYKELMKHLNHNWDTYHRLPYRGI